MAMGLLSNDMLAVYGLPLLVILLYYVHNKQRLERKNFAAQQDEIEAGLTEPVSLHPKINPSTCIGCASCVRACPEQNVLGLIDGKGQLVAPTNCIGHGACATACPVDAISLVFGTETRGVELPILQPNFETNVPGIFIAGELGGMGLIRNAVEQGKQAMTAIAERLAAQGKRPGARDVVIVGAGPAGLSASLAAMERGLNYVTLEMESLGGAIVHHPRGKVITTMPVVLPLVGRMKFREVSKEELLAYWQDIERRTGVQIRYGERVGSVTRDTEGFTVTTQKGAYQTRAILLAIGRRGIPRKLDVPGEDLSKVVYWLDNPEQYRSRRVLVVGGGDSALEAATTLGAVHGTTVTLSYRGEAFTRTKRKSREKLHAAQQAERVQVLLASHVRHIRDADILMEQTGRELILENDAVIVCAGGELPTPFLKAIGVEVETKYGTS